jgi:glycosyltransferase involved in cell wall biosynthesis
VTTRPDNGPDGRRPDVHSPEGPGRSPGGPRLLIVTVVHDPEDARIRHRQLSAALAAGFDVTYAAPFSAYGRIPPEGVRAVDLPRARGRRRLAAVRAARRLIRAESTHTDLVLVHDPELLLSLAGLRGPARIWDVHEDTAVALGMRGWLPGFARRPAAAAIRALEWWADRRLHLLLAEESYASRFHNNHPVVPNTVPVPSEIPPPPGQDRVVYLGRLTVARGALELIDVARLVHETVRVELVGPADPDCAQPIAKAQEEGILVHHGFVPNDRAFALLAGACAGLSLLHDEPNYAHSRPTKAMEYMASGVPVITTPNPVSVELVERYGCGVVVPFADPEACAREILRLVTDDAGRERLGRAGRACAEKHFDWRVGAVTFLEALTSWAQKS